MIYITIKRELLLLIDHFNWNLSKNRDILYLSGLGNSSNLVKYVLWLFGIVYLALIEIVRSELNGVYLLGPGVKLKYVLEYLIV
jgi:hypothetical protein